MDLIQNTRNKPGRKPAVPLENIIKCAKNYKHLIFNNKGQLIFKKSDAFMQNLIKDLNYEILITNLYIKIRKNAKKIYEALDNSELIDEKSLIKKSDSSPA